MADYVAALDQGTTSTRFIIFDQEGEIVSASQKEHRQIFPQAGWVEHDPLEIWSASCEVMATALAKANVSVGNIVGLGITNQRETTVVWDRKAGKPYHN